MNRHRGRGVAVWPLAVILTAATTSGVFAQRAVNPAPSQPSLSESAVAQALAANPTIAPYQLATSMDRQGRVVVSGRVGSKGVYDTVIRTLISLGIPFVDRLVIDTGLGVPVATRPAVVARPYVYPPPLFGVLDEPFYGFEPPVIAYPPWWGALDAPRRAESMTAPESVPAEPGPPQPVTETPRAPEPAEADMPPPPPRPFDEPEPGPVMPRAVPPPPAPGLPPARATATAPGSVASCADQAVRGALKAEVAQEVQVVIAPDGAATVSGLVPSVYEAMLAFRAVERTPGVTSLVDRLQFPVPEPDGANPLITRGRPEDVEPYLKAQLARHLGGQAHIDRVRVQADLLQIDGSVPEASDTARVLAILRSLPILRGYRIEPSFRAI